MSQSPIAQKGLNIVRERWTRSKTLTDAIPRLRKLFEKSANKDNIFPLFPPNVHKSIWRTVPINPDRQAAILVPLVSYEGVPSLLFTTRSSNLPTHASEVSFPGGHWEEGLDSSLDATAVREAKEELLGDYPWEDIEIIGRATPVPSIKGTPVTPVLVVLPHEISSDTFPGSPDEVDEVFCVSLEQLLKIETTEPSKRFKANVPVFPASADQKIWGLTAVVTRPILHTLLKPVLLHRNRGSTESAAVPPSSKL
jgi:8-oxo-dGTP pyrophosphatase MutT (NUDIX family)